MRIAFGANTIKPDTRVKQVLEYEFGLEGLTEMQCIDVVEQLAALSGIKVITIDQILVKYGSSYYNKDSNKLTVKQIAKTLKELHVDNKIIKKATKLTTHQINRL